MICFEHQAARVVQGFVDLRAFAIADNGSYLATDSSGQGYVFNVEAGPHVELGDVLRGDFGSPDEPFRVARNVTQGKAVCLLVQHRDPNPDPTIEFLLHEMIPHPRIIFTGSGRLRAENPNTEQQLREEISALQA